MRIEAIATLTGLLCPFRAFERLNGYEEFAFSIRCPCPEYLDLQLVDTREDVAFYR